MNTFAVLTIIGIVALGVAAFISTLFQENRTLRKSLDMKNKAYEVMRKAYYQERRPIVYKEKSSQIVDN